MDEPTVPDLLEIAAVKWPDAVAVESGTDRWTFADLDYAANEIAGRVPGGARIAFRAEPTIASVAAIWGIPRGGGIAVPIDRSLSPTQASELADSVGAVLGWPPQRDPEAADTEIDSETQSFIMMTSGSSGRPRGVIITRGNIEAAARASQIHLGTRQTDRWLLVLPLNHVGGLGILWRGVHDGAPVFIQDGFDTGAVSAALQSGVTWTSLVPTMLRRLLEAERGPWPGVRGVLIGGAHVASAQIAAADAAGLSALATYGMTETTAQAATVRPGNVAAAMGTVGHPLPGVAVAVDAAPGEPGPILISGPTVSPGYVDEPPRVGPLATRDVGYFDGAGRLVVLGRLDDVIISGGENVYPTQVENVLLTRAGVAEAVVFGAPDPEWGERVVAVVCGAGVDGSQLGRELAERLPRHSVPKEIHVREALPLLPNGKIDRAAVRDLVAGQATDH